MRLRQSLGSALAMPVAKLIVALLSDSRERRSQVPIYARFWREWAGLRRSEGGQLLFCCVLLRYLFSGITNGFSSIPFSRATVTAFKALSGCSSCLKNA